MNIKTSVVKPVGILAEREFIAESIKRQNNKSYTSFKVVCFQSICVLAVFAICIAIIGLTLRAASFYQSKKQIETEALLKQLEQGEVVEMKARVGAKP